MSNPTEPVIRLSLYVAKSGIASRRKADELIAGGKVSVNGQVVVQPYYRVSETDIVKVEAKTIQLKNHVYLIFNKPKGVTSTREDRFAEKLIVDFFPPDLREQGIYPVGRLDKNSTGLIIMTNDGDFCYRLTHPKFEIEKEYLVRVIGDFGAGECEKARRGVEDDGDNLKVRRIKVLEHNEKTSLLKVVTAEGKKRHLRRLFSGLGFGVVELKRIRIGGLGIGELGSGSYAMMKQEELAAKVFARKKTL